MYKSSFTGAQIDAGITAANAAAPQSTTYTKSEVDTALSGKQAILVVDTNLDSAPTENSTNPVTSGGVYTAISSKANTSDLGTAAAKGFDASPTSGHTDYAVSSGGVYTALAGKATRSSYIKNDAETITIDNDTAYFLVVNGVNISESGVFMLFKAADNTTPRIVEITTTQDFSTYFTVAANANSNTFTITPISSTDSNKWYVTNLLRL